MSTTERSPGKVIANIARGMVRILKAPIRWLRILCGPTFQWVGYTTGLMQITSGRRSADGAVVLMYHSVADHRYSKWIDPRFHVPCGVFEEQMSFLASNKRVIRLSELVAALVNGRRLDAGTTVITFDDGCLDTLEIAAPILDRYGLPATVFLPTGYVDRGENQWVDQLYTAFRFRTTQAIALGSQRELVFNLNDMRQQRACYALLCDELLTARIEKRHVLLEELFGLLRPATGPPPRLTMTWNDVRALLNRYRLFEIGGHGVEHVDITALPEQEAVRELLTCRQRIRDETGIAPRHFSSCYCRSSDTLRRLLANTGFEAAFGACGGHDPFVRCGTDLYDMPRVEAPATMHGFALAICPANRGVWRRMGGL